MSVTVPLPFRRSGAHRSSRHRTVRRAAAVSAVVGVLAAADQHAAITSPTERVAAGTDAPLLEAEAPADRAQFTAFTPPQAEEAPPAPEVAWEENMIAAEHPRALTIRPVAGMLSSNFGMRWGAMHAGIDFADQIGAPIAAVTDGVVIEAGPASGFGLWVRVQQDDGTIGVYGHMNEILVSVGQQVRAGEVIATVGNRGYSTGPHLHYEVHQGENQPIDPIPWLIARGLELGPLPVD